MLEKIEREKERLNTILEEKGAFQEYKKIEGMSRVEMNNSHVEESKMNNSSRKVENSSTSEEVEIVDNVDKSIDNGDSNVVNLTLPVNNYTVNSSASPKENFTDEFVQTNSATRVNLSQSTGQTDIKRSRQEDLISSSYLYDAFCIESIKNDSEIPIYISWAVLAGLLTIYSVCFICQTLWFCSTGKSKQGNNKGNEEKCKIESNTNSEVQKMPHEYIGSSSLPAESVSTMSQAPSRILEEEMDAQKCIEEHKLVNADYQLRQRHNVSNRDSQADKTWHNTHEEKTNMKLPERSLFHPHQLRPSSQLLQQQKSRSLLSPYPHMPEQSTPLPLSPAPPLSTNNYNNNNNSNNNNDNQLNNIQQLPPQTAILETNVTSLLKPSFQASQTQNDRTSKDNSLESVLSNVPLRYQQHQENQTKLERDVEKLPPVQTEEEVEEDDGMIHNQFLERWAETKN